MSKGERRETIRNVLFGAFVVGVIGVFVGLLFGAAWQDPDPMSPGQKIGTGAFMGAARWNVPGTEEPRLRNVIVYPGIDDPDGQPVYRVTFERYSGGPSFRDANAVGEWNDEYIDARTPFARIGRRGERREVDVIEWLEQMRTDRPALTFGRAWWKEPAFNYAIFGAGMGLAGVLVGGVLGQRGVLRVPTLPERAPKPKPKPKPVATPVEESPAEVEERHRKTRGEFYPVLQDEEEPAK